MFDEKLEEKAKKYAMEKFPEEAVCVFTDTDCIFLENVAKDREHSFLVDEKALLEIGMDKVRAVIHSHPTKYEPWLYPSALDMQTQMSYNLPFGIIACSADLAYPIEYFGDCVPKAPLEGRFFIHGKQDCYSLIRDWYLEKLDIVLPDFPRDWLWWEKGRDLYLKFYDAGFYEIPFSDLAYGDVFLMPYGLYALKNCITTHGGIYLGDETILHHKCSLNPYDKGQLSVRESMHRYAKYFTYCLRHKDRKGAVCR